MLELASHQPSAAQDPNDTDQLTPSARTNRSAEVATVSIATLLPGESLRSGGLDQEHVLRLTEVETELPPILVDRRTMRVIDGFHRLMATLLRGGDTIGVEFFDGSEADAFLRAVESNVGHGLPLSLADRRTAASRIIASHPHLSDRAIARASGLGARTVAGIRKLLRGAAPEQTERVGRDGRVRPLNSAEGRRRAAELIRAHPEASLRELAAEAGISPATVRDVRLRLQAGEAPVAEHSDAAEPTSRPETEPASSQSAESVGPAVTPADVEREEPLRAPSRLKLARDPAVVLDKLVRDPSLRHKEEGRNLLRILRQNAIGMEHWIDLTQAVPPHCGSLVIELARRYADTWLAFAQELDQQIRRQDDESRPGRRPAASPAI